MKSKPAPTSAGSSAESVIRAENGEHEAPKPAIEVENLHFRYGAVPALSGINLRIPRRQITAFIGPSGCGKSTLLRCFNRMNDMIPGAEISRGRILIDGGDVQAPELEVIDLRRKVGMVFQKSNPFPCSIFENVAYGLRIGGMSRRADLSGRVEEALRAAALWEEIRDRLNETAFGLSGGQQQRLCIARAIAVKPSVLLMDEPCSALDPVATLRIEDLIQNLKQQYTIVMVTHNMQQATRCSDRTAFFYLGELIEEGETTDIFRAPQDWRTADYVSGRFG